MLVRDIESQIKICENQYWGKSKLLNESSHVVTRLVMIM